MGCGLWDAHCRDEAFEVGKKGFVGEGIEGLFVLEGGEDREQVRREGDGHWVDEVIVGRVGLVVEAVFVEERVVDVEHEGEAAHVSGEVLEVTDREWVGLLLADGPQLTA